MQYVTGTGAGTPWPPIADAIRTRAEGDRVIMLAPTAYTQVVQLLLSPRSRYEVVGGRSPLAAQAQFAILDEIPFFDATAAEVVRERRFVVIGRYRRPRGGAQATLLERPTGR